MADRPALRTAPDVRLRLGAWGDGDRTLIERIGTRQRWQVTDDIAAVVAAFCGGRQVSDAVQFLATALGVAGTDVEAHIWRLADVGILIQDRAADDRTETVWREAGWSASLDHHIATYDYPLVDYAVDGYQEDRRRMASYGPANQNASARALSTLDAPTGREPLPPINEALGALDDPVRDALHPKPPRHGIDKASLLSLLAVALGFFPPGSNARKLRRTSPSGGARHPIEGYAITNSIPGLPDRVWRIDPQPMSLTDLRPSPSREWLASRCSGLYMAPFEPDVLVILTAQFERNMFRYREPRTFRTVFIDAGHILGTLEMASTALGFATHVHHALHDKEIEDLLVIEGLVEGVVAGAAISGASHE